MKVKCLTRVSEGDKTYMPGEIISDLEENRVASLERSRAAVRIEEPRKRGFESFEAMQAAAKAQKETKNGLKKDKAPANKADAKKEEILTQQSGEVKSSDGGSSQPDDPATEANAGNDE